MSSPITQTIKKITINDKEYPEQLKEIHDPPQELYTKGEIKNQDKVAVAIVGTRKYSQYGKQVAFDISGKLARLGITIVSGLARGIDTFAHQAALENGGRTIAVLGSGMDKKSFSPSCNYDLGEKISQNGAVITEYPEGTQGAFYTYPQRNRIISGLSLGVVVIEAPEESGALITANFALEQNREVFAIPGDIYAKNSQGTNKLIKMGAKSVTDINDILEELNLTHLLTMERKQVKPESKEEEIILYLLSAQPTHIDEIIIKSGLSPSAVNSTLMMLELKKAIRNLGNNNFILCN